MRIRRTKHLILMGRSEMLEYFGGKARKKDTNRKT
jgi:hypothetical protein